MKEAIATFDQYAADYDRWFDENREIVDTQVAALRRVLPRAGIGLEIGAGSGRFASRLGVTHGLDPARRLLAYAKNRQVEPVQGIAEALPYKAETFDYLLLMTSICFFADLGTAFCEAFRVLRPEGRIVIGFLDKYGEIARRERGRKTPGRFLRSAIFRSTDEVTAALYKAGFSAIALREDLNGLCIVTAEKDR